MPGDRPAPLSLDEFRSPGVEFRAVTLWMLNDRLSPAELRRQLRGFRDAGWGRVITRTFDGLMTEYLSEDWMQALEAIILEAHDLGMRVWLQAGHMPNGIPDLPEELEYCAVSARGEGQAVEASETLLRQDETYAYVRGRLPHVLDLLNPQAVETYLERSYEQTWFRRFGEHFGRTIEGIWVDEPCLQPGRLPYGPQVLEAFRARWGGELADLLPSLFRRVGEWRGARHRYWRTVLDLLVAGYFKPVQRWCREHGVLFTGHLMGEDTLRAQAAYTVSAMPLYPFMGVPGIDHLTGSLRWSHGRHGGQGPLFVMTPKQCSSAAHQHGLSPALAEMYGVSTQALTFADRKRIGEWFSLLGINLRCLHGSFYSLRRRRKRIYPPHLSHQQPWWPLNRIVSDYFARLHYALRQGRFVADVLVVHPGESAFCVYEPTQSPSDEQAPDEMDALNDSLARLSENLLRARCGFDYGDERTLAESGRVEDGALCVGPMRYRVVVLPSIYTLRAETVHLLQGFVAAGGTVLGAGEMPRCADGEADEAVAALCTSIRPVANEPEALKQAVRQVAPARVEVSALDGRADHVFVHERELDGARLAYLLNTGGEPVRARVGIAGGGALETWDPATGVVAQLACRSSDGVVTAELRLEPHQSHLLLLREVPAKAPLAPAVARTFSALRLDGLWRLSRRDPNALTLDFCRLRRGEGPYGDLVPSIALKQVLQEEEPYEGPIALRFAFHVEARPSDVALVAEDAPDWRIAVNGRPVEYAGRPGWVDRSFLPTDITPLVCEGENVIEMARDFMPLRRPAFGHAGRFANIPGVELESVYLIGAFAVRARLSEGAARPKCARFAPGFAIAEEARETAGDLLADGYPFYAGRIALSRTVRIEREPAGRAVLRLPRLDACAATVRINGVEAGTIAWAPHEVDVTRLLRPGENEVEIELVNTLRNLLGPHHRPQGEPDHVWGEVEFSGRYCWDTRQGYPRWFERREQETEAWTDDYFFVPFGLAEGAEIRFVEAEGR